MHTCSPPSTHARARAHTHTQSAPTLLQATARRRATTAANRRQPPGWLLQLDLTASLPQGLEKLVLGGVVVSLSDMRFVATCLTRLCSLQVRRDTVMVVGRTSLLLITDVY